MSRVNEHCEDYGHVMVIYAYKHPESGESVVRLIDPQDLKIPIYDRIDQAAEFLTRSGQRVTQDTFAAIVDIHLLPRYGK